MEEILLGTTDRSVFVFIPDPASTTGVGKTGLNAAAITVTYSRMETDNDCVHTDVTSSVNDLSALTDAHSDWGWKEVSSTLSKGLYRLDIADAVFASGAWYAVVQVTITSGTAAATPKGFKLVELDMQSQSAADLKDFADAGYDPSTNKVQGVVLTDTVTTYTGNTPQTGDAYAIVNSGTHGNAALKTIVDDIPTNAELATSQAAADDATLAAIAALNNLSSAQVNAEVDTALQDIHLDHLLAVTYDPASKPGAADALLNELVESDAGVARYTANALEQAPAGGGGTSDWTADQRTAIAAILGIPAAGTTPDDPTTGILDTIRDAVGTKASQTSVDDLPTNAELATALGTADDATLAAIGALNNVSTAQVVTSVGTALATYKALAADAAYNATTINGTLEVTFETP